MEKLECRPYADQTYMNMKAKAMVIAAQPKRKVEQLDSVVTTFKPISDHKHNVSRTEIEEVTGEFLGLVVKLHKIRKLFFSADRIRQEEENRWQKVPHRQDGRHGHALQCLRETSILQH